MILIITPLDNRLPFVLITFFLKERTWCLLSINIIKYLNQRSTTLNLKLSSLIMHTVNKCVIQPPSSNHNRSVTHNLLKYLPSPCLRSNAFEISHVTSNYRKHAMQWKLSRSSEHKVKSSFLLNPNIVHDFLNVSIKYSPWYPSSKQQREKLTSLQLFFFFFAFPLHFLFVRSFLGTDIHNKNPNPIPKTTNH